MALNHPVVVRSFHETDFFCCFVEAVRKRFRFGFELHLVFFILKEEEDEKKK